MVLKSGVGLWCLPPIDGGSLLGDAQEATRRVLVMVYAALDDPDYNLLLRTASAKPGEVIGEVDSLEDGQTAKDAMDQTCQGRLSNSRQQNFVMQDVALRLMRSCS